MRIDQRGVDFLDDGRRHIGRAVPAQETGQVQVLQAELRQGGYIRHERGSLGRTHSQDFGFAALGIANTGCSGAKGDLHTAVVQVWRHLRTTFVGHVHQVSQSALICKNLPKNVGGGADAKRGVAQFPGVGLAVGDQFPHIVDPQATAHHQDQRALGTHGNGREILERIKGHRLERVRNLCQCRRRAVKNRVAVRRRLDQLLRRQQGPGTGTVVHNHWGSQDLRHARGDGPGLGIDTNAGREPDDDPDGFALDRELLRLRAQGGQPKKQGWQQATADGAGGCGHDNVPLELVWSEKLGGRL